MSELTDRRRGNLKAVIERVGGVSKASKLLGCANPSFVSQITGPNPTRELSEKSARKFERRQVSANQGTLTRPQVRRHLPTATALPASSDWWAKRVQQRA